MNKVQIIRRALDVSDRFWRSWHRTDVCIAACRSLQLALREVNIRLDPIVARAQFVNKQMKEAIDDCSLDDLKADERKAFLNSSGAWGVGLGYLNAKVRLGLEPMPYNKWGAHLALVELSDSLLIDPTLGQASRPLKGIELPQSIVEIVPRSFIEQGGELPLQINAVDGVYMLYPREPRSFTASADWVVKRRHKQLVKEILRAIR
jgi:hypothetical protein